MKNVIVIILLPFLMDGVFGADEMKEVTDGDSLTLPTGITQTQSSDRILWLYGSDKIIIAKIDKGIYSTDLADDERFKGNLELDKQTGSLTIKNIRIKNTGPYELEINRATSRRFNVKVYASLPTPDIDSPQCVQTPAGSSSPKCVFQCSVQTSEQTTLSWYSGNRVVSSKISDICSSLSLHLEVNYEDKNIYSCMVNNPISNKTKHLDIPQLCKPCEAPGLSSGAVAGIVVVLLVLAAGAAAAAAAAGVIYYRRKISELERKYEEKSVSVMNGESVTLNTDTEMQTADVTEIQTADLIEWRFGDGGHLIAAIRGGIIEIYDSGLDERFTDRLELDKKTGSLTITDTRTPHSGLYHLMIHQYSKIKYKMFNVSVRVESVSVFEGERVILKTDTEIQSDDLIEWRFGDKGPVIAELRGGILKYDGVPDGRFSGRLKLDEKTGSLTITNTEVRYAGVYQLQITSNSGVSCKTFRVVFRASNISVKKGKNMILNPEIQKDDQIQWRFGDQDILIAELGEGTGKTHDDADERFRDRLKLDEKTGSLIITDLTTDQSGEYKLLIFSNRGTTTNRFVVTVYESVSVNEGERVILQTKTEIQSDDLIEWRFGDKGPVIATSSYLGIPPLISIDGRFRGRLEVDKKTGSLTITNTEVMHAGDYKLQIKSKSGVSGETFRVTVRGIRMNDSATVQMPPVNEEDPDVGNEQEGTSLL